MALGEDEGHRRGESKTDTHETTNSTDRDHRNDDDDDDTHHHRHEQLLLGLETGSHEDRDNNDGTMGTNSTPRFA